MDSDTRDAITWVIGTALGLLMLAGLAVRYVLIPYLRDHLVQPVADVHKQVTENHHANAQPTMLDRIDDVHTEVRALAKVMDGHLDASDRWLDHITRELHDLHDKVRRLGRKGAS